MRDYQSWSFADKSFAYAALISILWHLFWFFSVRVVITDEAARSVNKTKFVSLGPVIDDELFRTLIEARPETSPTYYRDMSEFRSATDVPEQTMGRHASGEVMSLPGSAKFSSVVRSLMAGDKAAPSFAVRPLEMEAEIGVFELQGDFEKSEILSRPELNVALPQPAVLELEVDLGGNVASVKTAQSSGDASVDKKLEDNARQWIFTPKKPLGESRFNSVRILFGETKGS